MTSFQTHNASMTPVTARTVWLTGLSGAGKSTLARGLCGALRELGRTVCVLDGDAVRMGLCSDLGFSEADRAENIRRVAEVARLMNAAGVTVICALISPLAADRNRARAIVGDAAFLEVHVAASLEVCEQRDPKGLYRKARAGEIRGFTGIDARYEAPLDPDLRLDTGVLDEAASLTSLLRLALQTEDVPVKEA